MNQRFQRRPLKNTRPTYKPFGVSHFIAKKKKKKKSRDGRSRVACHRSRHFGARRYPLIRESAVVLFLS
jgi:hypothetical protein